MEKIDVTVVLPAFNEEEAIAKVIGDVRKAMDRTAYAYEILVVDDSKTELMFLTDLLGKKGFSVKTAENAEDAFRRLAEDKPELILMDVVMPGQNGFQLTRAISRDPLYSDIPIIMCTSKNQETDRVWGMRQGARDYITKPVNAEELMAKISALG